jgi:plasmid maintenance system antidote protein VapI
MVEPPAKWEWKVFILIIICLLVIIGLIWYSYILSNRGQITTGSAEGFKTYADLVTELNANRNDLIAIANVQNQLLVNIDPDVNKYINGANIITPELTDRLNANFDIQFSQKLQDSEIRDLQGRLDALKQKLAKTTKTMPDKYILKSLGGSAFDMLGNPNEFSLRIYPKDARCLSYSSYEMAEAKSGNPSQGRVYNSSGSVQCDAGGADKTQRFKLTEIKNNLDFNNLVGDEYDVPEYYTLNNYPFMVAQPINGTLRENGMLGECITFDNSGLSVEPCNGAENQRWHTYTVNE